MQRGRPRKFDINQALDAAMITFWRCGYQGTSLDDLTQAMGINRPSLYATFGDKEQLFLRAVDRYAEQYGGRANAALDKHTHARDAIRAFFTAVITQLTDTSLPPGCLRVNSTLECIGVNEAIQRKLVEQQFHLEETFLHRLQRAQDDGQIAPDEDVQALACFLAGTVNSLVVRASVDANAERLQQMVDMAMRVWPD
ncbi:MAG: TetR/AcrR family transcriptional regulator [Chloroflexota bacterium]